MRFLFTIFFCCVFSLGLVMGLDDGGADTWLTGVRSHYKAQRYEILKEYFSLLSLANVSADKEGITHNARFIKKMMEKRGIQVKIQLFH